MKVLSVVGARPQFIKSGPVSRALDRRRHEELLIHTGQHYDPQMSAVFFQELDLRRPALNLAVGSESHAAQTAAMLPRLEMIMREERPDWVIVYGDTNSTLAGALAASKVRVPLAHVEAGLRSRNRRMPEEINRLVADTLSDLLFPPTAGAASNLLCEGVPAGDVILSGDVMLDAVRYYGAREHRAATDCSDSARGGDGEYVLATIHRAENVDVPERLRTIASGLGRVARHLPVVFPVHPRTEAALARLTSVPEEFARVDRIAPAGYLEMLRLERNAQVIVTDSGGVQKEALFQCVPCVTLRAETEWSESVTSGWNRLCPPVSATAIEGAVLEARGSRGRAVDAYGSGDAADRIVAALEARRATPFRGGSSL